MRGFSFDCQNGYSGSKTLLNVRWDNTPRLARLASHSFGIAIVFLRSQANTAPITTTSAHTSPPHKMLSRIPCFKALRLQWYEYSGIAALNSQCNPNFFAVSDWKLRFCHASSIWSCINLLQVCLTYFMDCKCHKWITLVSQLESVGVMACAHSTALSLLLVTRTAPNGPPVCADGALSP